jgi:hypothetical protein
LSNAFAQGVGRVRFRVARRFRIRRLTWAPLVAFVVGALDHLRSFAALTPHVAAGWFFSGSPGKRNA